MYIPTYIPIPGAIGEVVKNEKSDFPEVWCSLRVSSDYLQHFQWL